MTKEDRIVQETSPAFILYTWMHEACVKDSFPILLAVFSWNGHLCSFTVYLQNKPSVKSLVLCLIFHHFKFANKYSGEWSLYQKLVSLCVGWRWVGGHHLGSEL